MHRRAFIQAGLASVTLATVPASLRASDANIALLDSELIYLSPYQSSGSLSRCQAEVWYAMLGADIFVVTASESWRVQAPLKGLVRTKLWIGDLGVWKNADYGSLPSVGAVAKIETDKKVIELALQQFGYKYSTEWGKWGPRFKRGLADGSRTMLRYGLST
ncbi:MAG: hypothetical protein HOA25_16785 [Gammaproteobacteria bacterium]|nr:hypothetical protein [Gammaproteobacteria bacterium]